MEMLSNTLRRAAWILISLGIVETLFLIHAIYTGGSFAGGAFFYILLGIFLLRKGKIAYRLSQFTFTLAFFTILVFLVTFLVIAGQIYTATDIPIRLSALGMGIIVLIIYCGVIGYLVMLLHHPDTRRELNLDAYQSSVSTLHIPLARVIIIPLLLLVIVLAGMLGPHLVKNPYVPITVGLSEDTDVRRKVGDITLLELVAFEAEGWNIDTIWRVHGDKGSGVFRAKIDPDSKLRIVPS